MLLTLSDCRVLRIQSGSGHMEKMGILPTALFAAAALILVWPREVAGYTPGHKCVHEPVQPIVGVHIAGSGGPVRDRRFALRSSEFKPIRLFIHYDDSVNTEIPESDRDRLQNNVIPNIKNYLEAALKTIPLTGPILLDRECDGTLANLQTETVKECIIRCMNTICGKTVIPEDHLKRCVECDGSNMTDDCVTRRGTADGAGIPDADMVIYVSTVPCNGSGTIAFANACQLESKYDRPIAGHINFCPRVFQVRTNQASIATGIHEVMHALVFSPPLFAFFRDSYGNPRTPRDQDGYPRNEKGEFGATNNTVATITYDDWLTRDGPISHQVEMIVTPKVVEEAKAQFGCNEVMGVELENQGGNGTAAFHWEHRVLGNEGMTGAALFNPVYSRITFALFEDSGWYRVNYSLAQPLAWGRNRGCNIPHGSCAAHIKEQEASQRTLSPFCKELTIGSKRSCTVDRDSSAQCSLVRADEEIPPEYQYFNDDVAYNSSQLGSQFNLTDFCPFQLPYSLISCSNPSYLPYSNLAGETYGPGSRCIEHGRTWTRTVASDGYARENFNDVGCYQYSCSQSGVQIIFLGTRYLCSCEGEELVINTTIGDAQYVGSFICPSCLSLCFDELDNCPQPEPPACPGRVTQAVPLEIVDVQAFCSHVVWRIPSVLPCGYVSGYDIRLVNTVTNQEVVQRVDTSATFYSLGSDDRAKEPTSVQVRFVSADDTTGPFSPLIPLGCPAPEPRVYFELNGVALANNSVIKVADVGSGESSLLCKTDRESCCGTPPNREGEFYYPNGVQVPIRNAGHAFYRDRRAQRIRLNRRLGANAPTGVFRCEIRAANGVIQKLFITLREW